MQPRTTFEDMDALVDSVKEFGLLQPILVRPVAGKPTPTRSSPASGAGARRRRRSCTKCRWSCAPWATRTPCSSAWSRTCSAPISRRSTRRWAIAACPSEFKQTQEDIARTVGKSRPHVANTLQAARPAGRGAGDDAPRRALRRPGARPDRRARSAGRGAARGRREAVGARPRAPGRRAQAQGQGRTAQDAAGGTAKSADTRALEKRIEEALGLKADLRLRGLGEQSLLTLEIRDFDQLDTVVERLTRR